MLKAIDINRCLGEKLREAREVSGMNKSIFAKKIRVSIPQLSKYESGANQISISRLILIAETLSLNLNYFLDDIS